MADGAVAEVENARTDLPREEGWRHVRRREVEHAHVDKRRAIAGLVVEVGLALTRRERGLVGLG